MSKTPKDRQVPSAPNKAAPQDDLYDGYDDDEYGEAAGYEYVPAPPKTQPKGQAQAQGRGQRGQTYRPRSVEVRQPGPNPVLIGGIAVFVLAVVVLAAYLLGSSARSNNNQAAVAPTVVIDTSSQSSQSDTSSQDTAATDGVPRITIADFLKLYNDMAKRPVILDASSKADYDDAHIKGAISFPSDQVDAMVGQVQLPKDKMIVIYCPCPHEEEAVNVAQQLNQKYHFSYDNLRALTGGFNAWDGLHQTDPVTYPEEP